MMWILVVLEFCCCVFSSAWAAVIQPFSFPSPVLKGQSVTVTCAVTAGSALSFAWSRDGQPLPTADPLVRMQSAEEYSLLLLRAVDPSRTANYTCTATSTTGEEAHWTAELVVYEPPEWNVLPEDAEGVFGGEIRLDCSATGVPPPKMEWRKLEGDYVVPLSTVRGRHQQLSNGSILLTDVGSEDGGQYECSAANGIGENLRKTVTVIVHVPPQFHETYHLQKSRSSQSAVLRCDVTGDAPIKVKWTKEYMDNSDSRYKVRETPLPGGLLSELTVSRVTRKDAGLYTCSAVNAFGRAEKTVKLLVLEPPSSPSEVAVQQVERTSATVSWKAPYAGNSPITRYLLQYWRDTGSTPKLEEAAVSVESTSHALAELRPGTSYVVRVIADNEFGSSAPSLPLRFYTAEDTPSGYPTDITVFASSAFELIVRWKAPAPDQRNGAILGYDLGFREHFSGDPYSFRDAPEGALECVLEGLKENTKYEVVVRARNRAGKGPASVPVIARTREKGKLATPMLWVETTTADAITLKWSGNENFRSEILHHSVHYKAEGGKWSEKLIPRAHADGYTLGDLQENTLYFLYLQAINGDVRSNPSVTVSARTADPSFERSTQMREGSSHQTTTLVISLSVVVSSVVIVCVIAGACVYVTRVNSASGKRDGHALSEFAEQSSRSTPLSRHPSSFRYVDVNSRPLLWCSTPAPPHDYPSPYATLPLRPQKRWGSDLSPAASERSEALFTQRADISEDKISNNRE